MKKLLSKYNFVDLSVYMKTQTGEYLNLTEFVISDDNEAIVLKSNSKFVIMLCSFIKKDRYICDVTLSELLALSGIHDVAFLRRFKDSSNNGDNDELLAVLCAKKIVDYNYGKVIKKENEVYSFHRQAFAKIEEKRKKVYPCILEKVFYIA